MAPASRCAGSLRAQIMLLLLATLLCVPTGFSQYQDLQFSHLTVADGLSQSEVRAIVQDAQGFLWFGTTDGLNRYDGHKFTVFRHNPKASNSPGDNNIIALANDSSGDIWIATHQGGLNRYVYATNRFTTYAELDSLIQGNQAFFSAILIEGRDSVLLGTSDGQVIRFEPRAGKQRVVAYPMKGKAITTLARTPDGFVWIGTRGAGLHSLNAATGTVVSHTAGKSIGALPHNIVNALLVDRRGALWIGTNHGLAQLEGNGSFATWFHRPGTANSLSSNLIESLYEDASGELWLGTSDGGVNRFRKKDNTFQSYTHDPANPSSIASGSVSRIFGDRSGVLWLATGGTGLNMLLQHHSFFTTFSQSAPSPVALPGKDVTAVIEGPDGKLWVGLFDAGVLALDRNTGKVIRYRSVAKGVRALRFDRRGRLWIGNNTRGIDVLNTATGIVQRYSHNPDDTSTISSNEIRVFCEDRRGTIWVGTFGGGVNRYDPVTARFRRIRRSNALQEGGIDDHILGLYEDRAGTLWVGTNGGGLYWLNELTEMLVPATSTETGRYGLAGQAVFGITELEAGVLWLATYGAGLMKYDVRTRSLKRIAEEQGLASSSLYDIVPDDSGNLWLSSNNGLIRYNPQSGTVRNFSVADGLQSSEFNRGASYKSTSGELFFGGVGGLNSFFPDSIREEARVPPVLITSFKVFDDEYNLPQSVLLTNRITLAHDQNFIAFEFVALDYRSPQRVLYSYTLEGVDREWIGPSNRRYARYTHLDPGEYIFRVRSTNGNGSWNASARDITIVILPPFYVQWWFRLAILCAIIGVLYLFFRVRMEKALAIERMRVRIASDLHDDVGAALTKISLYSDLLKANPSADGLVDRIGTMSREIIASMSDIVWAIDARNDTLGDLIDRINYYASDVLQAKGINLEFSHEGIPKVVSLPVEHRQNIYLILKEAVNNIAKHSGASCAAIHFLNDNGRVLIVVQDNGVGFGDAHRRSGQGLKNMQMRAARSNASLAVESGTGTEIRLKTAIHT